MKRKQHKRARALPRTQKGPAADALILRDALDPGDPGSEPVVQLPARSGRFIDRLSSPERKQYPMAEGLMDYYPDALAMVSHVSYMGNLKHNGPGAPLHHSRGKSMDHADCIQRHLQERGHLDSDGLMHTACLAWRALALLQEEMEKKFDLPLPRNAWVDPPPPSGGRTKT